MYTVYHDYIVCIYMWQMCESIQGQEHLTWGELLAQGVNNTLWVSQTYKDMQTIRHCKTGKFYMTLLSVLGHISLNNINGPNLTNKGLF